MALIRRDRVAESTGTSGTVTTITAAGAISGDYQTLDAIGNGNQCDYTLISGGGGFETGRGTVAISGGTRTMSRDYVDDGSSGPGVRISLSGTSTLFCSNTARAASFPFDLSTIPISANTGFTTWRNQGTATIADYGDGIRMTVPGAAGDNLRLRTKAAPSTPYTIIATLALEASFQSFQAAYLGWDDGTKLHLIMLLAESTAVAQRGAQVIRYTNVTTYSSTDANFAGRGDCATFFIRRDGTTISFGEYRWGNRNPVTLYSVAAGSGWLANYNTLCWGGVRNNTAGTSTAYANLLMYRELPV